MGDIFDRVAECARGCTAERDFSFAGHTTVGIGGTARLCLYPAGLAAAENAMRAVARAGVPYVVLGAGANVLAADAGFDGVVISTEKMRSVRTDGETVFAESGANMARLLRRLAEEGLGGLSFMAGIPASVGGAVYMNAGTARGHIGDRVLAVRALSADGRLLEFSARDCAFGYKHTAFTDAGLLLLTVKLRARYCCRERALADMQEVLAERARLPRGRSMGCVFKNPEGFSAGALIERAGMKGAREGGAFVSCEHANFIINGGSATAREVRALIERVRGAVLRETGVRLTEEIVYIGDD